MSNYSKLPKYKDRLKRIEHTAVKLKKEVGKLDNLSARFEDVSKQYLDCLLKCKSQMSSIKHIVFAWFFSFLQFKDEIMVLLTGEILRDYHAEHHKDFIHKREIDKQSRLTFKAGSLSMLSTNGIDYEWRILNEECPDKYQDRLDVIANQTEEFDVTLDLQSKRLEKLFWEPMKATLNSLGIISLSFKLIETSHRAERINISTDKGEINVTR